MRLSSYLRHDRAQSSLRVAYRHGWNMQKSAMANRMIAMTCGLQPQTPFVEHISWVHDLNATSKRDLLHSWAVYRIKHFIYQVTHSRFSQDILFILHCRIRRRWKRWSGVVEPPYTYSPTTHIEQILNSQSWRLLYLYMLYLYQQSTSV